MTTNLKAGKSNQLRIQEISALIDELSTELNQRLNLEFTAPSPSNSVSSFKSVKNSLFPQKPAPLAIGKRVVITNQYRNLKGRTRVITRLTRTFVFLQLDNSTEIIQKRRQNVEHVHNDVK